MVVEATRVVGHCVGNIDLILLDRSPAEDVLTIAIVKAITIVKDVLIIAIVKAIAIVKEVLIIAIVKDAQLWSKTTSHNNNCCMYVPLAGFALH